MLWFLAFCFVLLLSLIIFIFFILCLNIFCPHQIFSSKFDPLFCVHRHAQFICKVSSPSSVLVYLFLYLIFNYCFFHTAQKVVNGVGSLHDCQGPSPILCDTVTLVYLAYYSFILLLCSHFLWFPLTVGSLCDGCSAVSVGPMSVKPHDWKHVLWLALQLIHEPEFHRPVNLSKLQMRT